MEIGIDVGGTFTDIVLRLSDGQIVRSKSPSTPGNEAHGVMNAIEAIAKLTNTTVADLLTVTEIINFGTTVATNAMLQGKGVSVGVITTSGFRDITELRRGWKEVMFDIKLPPPPTLVPRRWRLGVAERIGADGSIIQALDEDAVRKHARSLRAHGINSVAVCFLFAFVNPRHELRARQLVKEEHPDADIYISSEVMPRIREYERFSTTIVNAYLSPLLRSYVGRMDTELKKAGFRGQLYIMQSNGGSVSPQLAAESGCAALLSGPAAGVVAAARIGKACNTGNIIGVDMGGTSYDVSLVRDGVPDMRLGGWFNRHYVGLPMLGIHTIGAGGGSIAWIDSGGALRVGPQSAGAQPGPACYDNGGRHATVTDAFLCLGYLNPDYFLGGSMSLSVERAREAVRRDVADPLGMSIDAAAVGMLRIVNNNMSNAIRYVSVARGLDPRDFVLMSFGGAGSVTASSQARDLGIKRLLVPRSGSVFCALGELWADLKVSQIMSQRAQADQIDLDALGGNLDALAEPIIRKFTGLPGVTETAVERSVELHYVGQSHEITTPIITNGSRLSAAAWEATLERFHRKHKDLYAFDLRHRAIEVLSVSQDVVGIRPWSFQTMDTSAADIKAALKSTRRVCFEKGGEADWLDTPIFDGARLQPGARLEGPLVIEEIDTTIVVQPGDAAFLNGLNVFDVSIGDAM